MRTLTQTQLWKQPLNRVYPHITKIKLDITWNLISTYKNNVTFNVFIVITIIIVIICVIWILILFFILIIFSTSHVCPHFPPYPCPYNHYRPQSPSHSCLQFHPSIMEPKTELPFSYLLWQHRLKFSVFFNWIFVSSL